MMSERTKRIVHTVMDHKEELDNSPYPNVLLRMLNILAHTLLIGFGVIGAIVLLTSIDLGILYFSHGILTAVVGSYLLFIHYSFIGYFDKVATIDMDADDPSKQYLLRHKIMLYFYDWIAVSVQLRKPVKPFFLISMIILTMAACGYAYGIVVPTAINVLISLIFMFELARMESNLKEGYKEWQLQKKKEENV